jgi:aspartyl protease family protein
MNNARKALLLGLVLSLAVTGIASAQIDFTKYYALGDSLAAGVVNYGSVQKYQAGSVPALIAQPGQLKVSLLGMSFLNRLQSWEVRGSKLMMRGYP